MPVIADGGRVDSERLAGLNACPDCAPAILRAYFAVMYDEASDPRPAHLRFAPSHCRAVNGPLCDRPSIELALRQRSDLIPPPFIPDVPQASDARVRWVPIHTGGTTP